MTLGVVLSGGGARGAYEAGVLSYVFGDLPRATGHVPQIKLICGTSVGAVNGAFLASVADDPIAGMSRLIDLWTGLSLKDIFDFSVRHASRIYRVLLGSEQSAGVGLLDSKPMSSMIGREVNWRRLSRNIENGCIDALTVSTTQVSTGRTVVWVETAPGVTSPYSLPGGVIMRKDKIHPEHVLASAAIPLLFPPVLIGSDLYCEGGLRLNTPMAPAIHFGAERLLVVGMATPVGIHGSIPALAPGRAPGATFLLGKVLNAFMLDHVTTDLEELRRMNQMIEAGERAYGPEFMSKVNTELIKAGHLPRRQVQAFAVRPSLDIGRLAGEHLRKNARRFNTELGKTFLRLLDIGEGADADLASYLLFDGDFATRLVDLGRRDAEAKRDELADFLFGTQDP
ncbi:MAG: patatin-like phospholipase family protein [Sandaracinaceae bacterium]|nr:patatin-like phospholipase family protein [Sandaracinaceae bacterium]